MDVLSIQANQSGQKKLAAARTSRILANYLFAHYLGVRTTLTIPSCVHTMYI